MFSEIEGLVRAGVNWKDIFELYKINFTSISQLKTKFVRERAKRRTTSV